MKHIIDLAFKRMPKKVNANLYLSEDDDPADLLKILREMFPNLKNELIAVRVIVDDLKEMDYPFEIEMAKKVITGEIKGRFVNLKEEAIRILAADLDGNYPVLGVIDGAAAYWDIYGQSQNGDSSQTLKIILSKN